MSRQPVEAEFAGGSGLEAVLRISRLCAPLVELWTVDEVLSGS